MDQMRPDPDALLDRINAEEAKKKRGKLKVFFGAAPGVGKTYAMLEEARRQAEQGLDVLIGYAEPHIRPDTEMLLLGLRILPYKMVEYKGVTLKEFDLDAALARRPALICVDELAHSNAPGLRHARRYQDVLELLGAGLDVWTTLNVQHLESVHDIVERVSGVKVRETLPDWVLEQADDIQLVDISPEKLIERIAAGKIYTHHSVDYLTRQFFNRGNLAALRELALRRLADRVDVQMETFRRQNAVAEPWPAAERILVCIGPSPFSARLVRAARRMAMAFRTNWIALYVQTPGTARLPSHARERAFATLRLAEELGGQTVTLHGDDPAREILAYARGKNVARIIVGKPLRRRGALFQRSLVDQLIRRAGPIDIYIIRDSSEPVLSERPSGPAPRPRPAGYGWAVAITALTTILGAGLYHGLHLSNINVLMLDLLGVLGVAIRFGRGPAALASVLSVAAFDYTVVPPYYSFAVSDTQYGITFAVMLVAALLISTLTDRLHRQSEAARHRERRTAALLALSRDLAATSEKEKSMQTAVRHISEMFRCAAAVLLPGGESPGRPGLAVAAGIGPAPADEKEMSVAQWVFEHDQPAGRTTSTLPSAAAMYVPLRIGPKTIGVLALRGEAVEHFCDPDHRHFLEAFANQTALALERANLAEETRRAWRRVETESIRNTLLSGVSHDLRTPLAVITGSATALLEGSLDRASAAGAQMLAAIVEEAERMERLIANLLDMSRLESGTVQPRLEIFPLNELVASALARLKRRVAGRNIHLAIPADMPLLRVDGLFFEQALTNLIENAVEHTPPDTPLEISAAASGRGATIQIADRGPGLPAEHRERLFEKFFRAPAARGQRGAGLGLALVRAIVQMHAGSVTAGNRPGGGAEFTITLPQACTCSDAGDILQNEDSETDT